MLRAFYKSEMPHPWPALQLPKKAATMPLARPERQRQPLWNSRFALAASVIILLLGSEHIAANFDAQYRTA